MERLCLIDVIDTLLLPTFPLLIGEKYIYSDINSTGLYKSVSAGYDSTSHVHFHLQSTNLIAKDASTFEDMIL